MKSEDIKKIAKQEWGHYKISGKLLKYNQLVQNGNFESASGWTKRGSSDTLSVSNNILKLTCGLSEYATNGFGVYAYVDSIDVGHKCYVSFKAKSSFENTQLQAYYKTSERINFTPTTYFQTFDGLLNVNTTDRRIQILNNSSAISVSIGDTLEIKNVIIIDLTDLFGAGNEPTTLEQFYATDLGKEIQKGFVPPYSATNAIYEATAPLTFSNNDGTQTQTVSILQNGQPLQIGGIGTAKDYYLNASGKVGRALGKADLGNLNWRKTLGGIAFVTSDITDTKVRDERPRLICSKYESNYTENSITISNGHIISAYEYTNKDICIRDDDYDDVQIFKEAISGQILHYELATPTTEQANSVMLPKGLTKCHDTNGLELEMNY